MKSFCMPLKCFTTACYSAITNGCISMEQSNDIIQGVICGNEHVLPLKFLLKELGCRFWTIFFNYKPKDYYKRALTIPLLGHLTSEMDICNNDAVMSSPLCVLPALLVSGDGHPVQAALQNYADNLSSQVFLCRAFLLAAQVAESGSRTTQLVQFMHWENVTMNSAYFVYVAVTSAECERSFSAFRRVKTYWGRPWPARKSLALL